MPLIPLLSKAERAEINRANAQKSTGPRSPEGKARSSMNAFRHGLSAKHLTLHPDDAAAYMGHHRETILAYRPVGREEENLVGNLADANWLIGSANALEINSRALNALPLTDSDDNPFDMVSVSSANHYAQIAPRKTGERYSPAPGQASLENIGRHRSRLERALFKYRSEIKATQKVRFAFAAETRILKGKHGDSYDPAVHGPFKDDEFNEATSPALALCFIGDETLRNTADYRERYQELQEVLKDNPATTHIEYSWASFPFADGPQPGDVDPDGDGKQLIPNPDGSPYNPDWREQNEPNLEKQNEANPRPGTFAPLKKLIVFFLFALLTRFAVAACTNISAFETNPILSNPSGDAPPAIPTRIAMESPLPRDGRRSPRGRTLGHRSGEAERQRLRPAHAHSSSHRTEPRTQRTLRRASSQVPALAERGEPRHGRG